MAEHNKFGANAEEMACTYLKKKGDKILERNYFYDRADVDIIAMKDEVLVGVEVKARSTDYFGDPQEFITRKKIKLLVKAIYEYVQTVTLIYSTNQLSHEIYTYCLITLPITLKVNYLKHKL